MHCDAPLLYVELRCEGLREDHHLDVDALPMDVDVLLHCVQKGVEFLKLD